MNWVMAANIASLVLGATSAFFWIKSAIAKAPLPPEYQGLPDGDLWKINIFNGGELYGTMRLQAKWNSRAAFAAAGTVLMQVAATLLGM